MITILLLGLLVAGLVGLYDEIQAHRRPHLPRVAVPVRPAASRPVTLVLASTYDERPERKA